jgi:hypothetical protein
MWSPSPPSSLSIIASESAERDPSNSGGGVGAEEALLPLQPLFDLPPLLPPRPTTTSITTITSPPSACSSLWEERSTTFLAWPGCDYDTPSLSRLLDLPLRDGHQPSGRSSSSIRYSRTVQTGGAMPITPQASPGELAADPRNSPPPPSGSVRSFII